MRMPLALVGSVPCALALAALALGTCPPRARAAPATEAWEPVGLSGGGGMFGPAISPVDGRRMMVHCDMSGAYVTADGGRSWRMVHHRELTSNTRCRPAWHPTKAEVVFSPAGGDGRRLMVSTDGGTRWAERATLSGPLRGPIAIDPDDPSSMLVGVGEEVHRSDDGGRAWSACRGVRGEAVGFHFDRASPKDRRVVLAATRAGIWRSADSGRSWAGATAGLSSEEVRSFCGASQAKGGTKACILYCTVPCRLDGERILGGIHVSTDAGLTWKPAGTRGLNPDVKAFDRWAAGPIAQYEWVLASDADPERAYAFSSSTGVPPPHGATVYRTDDAGETWRATFQADPRWSPCNVEQDGVVAEDGQFYGGVPFGVAIDGRDPDHLLFVTGHAIATEDGGKTWFHADTRLAPGQKKPSGSGRTPGLDWLCNGLVVTTTWNLYEDPFRPRNRYVCYTDIGFARSEDAGRSWKWWSEKGRAPWRNTCYELAFDPDVPGKSWGAFSDVHDIPNANIVWERHRSTGPGGVCVSEDFATSWKPCSAGLPEVPVTSVVLDPKSPRSARTLYAGTFGAGVFRSTDGGATWQPRNDGLGAESNRRVCRVVLHPDGTLFALVTAKRAAGAFRPDGVGLHRSKDGGGTWQCLTGSERFLWPKDFTVDPADADTVYLGNCDGNGDGRGGLWATSNGGRSWKRLAREGPEHFGAYLHPTKKEWIYMTLTEGAPGAGLWLSKDGGRRFDAVEGLPFRNVQRVHFLASDPDAIYVTTFGGSVWRGTGVR